MKKKILALLLALVMCLSLLPAAALADDGDFIIREGVLTKYKGPGGDVVIPDGVTSIGAGAFSYCERLTSVTIPDSVTSIGPGAFSQCVRLASVTIPDSVTSISGTAFMCSGLRSVTIPSGVTSINNGTFAQCNGLTSVTIPEGVTSIDDRAFSECGSLTTVTIPSTVTSIGEQVFHRCFKLEDVHFGGTKAQWEAISRPHDRCLDDSVIHCSDGEVLPSVTISFDSKGGSSVPNMTIPWSEDGTYGELPTPTLEDYAFRGWYYHYTYGGSTKVTSSTKVQERYEHTLYASWTWIGKSTIRFWSSLDKDYVCDDIVLVNGQPYGELPTPTHEGYVFDGWFYHFTNGYGIGAGTMYVDSNSIVNGDRTLEARWTKVESENENERKQLTVSFDGNGGSSVYDRTVTVGETYGALPTPAREGYVFDGWYTSRSGGTEVTSSTTVTIDYDHTLYAHWTEADGKLTVTPGSVTFDKAQEGYAQPEAKTVTVKNAGEATITLSQPTAADFDLGRLSSTNLAPDATATFTVRPKAGLKAGTYTDAIVVKSADGKTSASVTVSFTVEGKAQETPGSASQFTDVPADIWYALPVGWAVDKGITNGTSPTTFSPNARCTQGHILTFLWRSRGEPEPKGTVTGTQYYAAAAQWAKEQGLTDSFTAGADCTRAMVVTYLWKLAGSPDVGTSDFTDVPAGAAYAKAVAWAVKEGITNGTSETTFSPEKTCTRGEIVTFLWRAYAN